MPQSARVGANTRRDSTTSCAEDREPSQPSTEYSDYGELFRYSVHVWAGQHDLGGFMDSAISTLLGRYESGKISRRAFVQGMAALAATAAGSGTAAAADFKVDSVNHVSLLVSNLQKSADFYKRVLGAPVGKTRRGNDRDVWQQPLGHARREAGRHRGPHRPRSRDLQPGSARGGAQGTRGRVVRRRPSRPWFSLPGSGWVPDTAAGQSRCKSGQQVGPN